MSESDTCVSEPAAALRVRARGGLFDGSGRPKLTFSLREHVSVPRRAIHHGAFAEESLRETARRAVQSQLAGPALGGQDCGLWTVDCGLWTAVDWRLEAGDWGVQGAGCRVQGAGCRVQGAEWRRLAAAGRTPGPSLISESIWPMATCPAATMYILSPCTAQQQRPTSARRTVTM